jgi:transcriptional repressor NrdR
MVPLFAGAVFARSVADVLPLLNAYSFATSWSSRRAVARSIDVALRKRDVDEERVERAISGIVRQLESSGEAEVTSDEIGRLAMDALKGVDDIAYIRFASVYRNFSKAVDFHNVIDELTVTETDRDPDA